MRDVACNATSIPVDTVFAAHEQGSGERQRDSVQTNTRSVVLGVNCSCLIGSPLKLGILGEIDSVLIGGPGSIRSGTAIRVWIVGASNKK